MLSMRTRHLSVNVKSWVLCFVLVCVKVWLIPFILCTSSVSVVEIKLNIIVDCIMDPMQVAFLIAEEDGLDLGQIADRAVNLLQPLEPDEVREDGRDREPRPRNQQFFEITIPSYNDDLFKEHFRMSRVAFQALTNILGRVVDHEHDKIDFGKKVLFTIWTISKPESFLAVGDRFDFGKSTGHKIFTDIVCALAGLIRDYVRFPRADEYNTSTNAFQQRSEGFPGVVGAIDGCHVPIKQPQGNQHDFYNRKGFHSIILQGTCDHMGKFIDCHIGSPGRMHDARVLRNSNIHTHLNNDDNPLLPANLHLIGDTAYPLMMNLMVPFRNTGHLTPAQINFNMKLNCIRSIIERAFGILKNKFRRLKFLDIADPDFGNKIIAAAVVLYNFLLTQGEINLYEEDIELANEDGDGVDENNEELGDTAAEKRDNICTNLLV